MRRDRDGELVEDDEQLPLPHHCQDGWKGETGDGRLIPCPTCRPHLLERLAEQRRALR